MPRPWHITLACLAATLALDAARAEIDLNPFDDDLYGSLQYARGMVELGGIAAQSPFSGGWGTGVHYQERGSLLAQMAFGAGSAAGAGARAIQTGQSQTYYVDRSPISSAGFEVDIFSGDDVDGFAFDLFYGIPFGSDRLPVILDFGLTIGGYDGGDDLDDGWAGFLIGAVVPVTRWAQAEANVRIGAGRSTVHGDLHLVGNLTNRFYARIGGRYLDGVALDAGLGVRL